MLTQRVHLQLLPQADLLQAVVEVGLRTAANGGRQSEDTHDLPLVSECEVNREIFKRQDNEKAEHHHLI